MDLVIPVRQPPADPEATAGGVLSAGSAVAVAVRNSLVAMNPVNLGGSGGTNSDAPGGDGSDIGAFERDTSE